MEARVRPATTGDLFWLRVLLGQMVEELGDAYPILTPKALELTTGELAARLGSNDPTLVCYVAEHEQVVGGFVLGNLCTRPSVPQHFLFVPFIYVIPTWRDTSVGRMLSAYCAEEAQKRGAQAVEFLCRPDDRQWFDRGWPVVAMVHALPVEAALASIVPRRPANGHGLRDDHAEEG